MQTYFQGRSLFTEKMDDLTKQLFDDVQKEQEQRMYVIWFAFKLLLSSLSPVLYFASQLADSRSQIQESGEVNICRKRGTPMCESRGPQGALFRPVSRPSAVGGGPPGISHFPFMAMTEVQTRPSLSASIKSKK